MIVKLMTEHHLEFLSLKGGCTGSSQSILVKIPHCWKSHVTTNFIWGQKEKNVRKFRIFTTHYISNILRKHVFRAYYRQDSTWPTQLQRTASLFEQFHKANIVTILHR